MAFLTKHPAKFRLENQLLNFSGSADYPRSLYALMHIRCQFGFAMIAPADMRIKLCPTQLHRLELDLHTCFAHRRINSMNSGVSSSSIISAASSRERLLIVLMCFPRRILSVDIRLALEVFPNPARIAQRCFRVIESPLLAYLAFLALCLKIFTHASVSIVV